MAKVLVDVKSPNIVHSAGHDGSVVSFDLTANKRMMSHMVHAGSVHGLSQRFDAKSELELVSCDSMVCVSVVRCDVLMRCL